MLDLTNEVFNLVRMERDDQGRYSLIMPTHLDILTLYIQLGVKAPVPDWDDPMFTEISRRVRERGPKLRAVADAMYSPRRTHIPQTPDGTFSVTNREAEIRQMSGSAALADCSSRGIQVTPHPTNPGITAMRAKNALLHAHRRKLLN